MVICKWLMILPPAMRICLVIENMIYIQKSYSKNLTLAFRIPEWLMSEATITLMMSFMASHG